jgi:alpha-galactosidase
VLIAKSRAFLDPKMKSGTFARACSRRLLPLTVTGTLSLLIPAPVHASARPPMGWNPCNGFQCHMWAIGEAELCDIASAIATNGMRAAGYTYFSIDDGWQGPRLPNGSITANSSAFPSGTLAPLAECVSTVGLQLGTYTDRGGLTCEKYSGSRGYEAADAATYASWGVRYVKEDSCNASEVEADRRSEYGAMAAALRAAAMSANTSIFFSVCGWTPTYASFGALHPPLGDSWRLGPDAGDWGRFLVTAEAVAGAAAAGGAFLGPGRGWPDVDMISGDWTAAQEVFRLSFIAVAGSPLLLSWDVRNASAATLPLAAYLNPEVRVGRGCPYACRAARLSFC